MRIRQLVNWGSIPDMGSSHPRYFIENLEQLDGEDASDWLKNGVEKEEYQMNWCVNTMKLFLLKEIPQKLLHFLPFRPYSSE